MTEPEQLPNKYKKEVVWDRRKLYYVADVYGDNRTFAEKHNLTLIAGYNYEAKYYRDLTAVTTACCRRNSQFQLGQGHHLHAQRRPQRIRHHGPLLPGGLRLQGKYLFEVNGRYDGTSRFPRAASVGFFPSFSAAYRISERFLRAVAQGGGQSENPSFPTVRWATSRSATTISSRPSRPKVR